MGRVTRTGVAAVAFLLAASAAPCRMGALAASPAPAAGPAGQTGDTARTMVLGGFRGPEDWQFVLGPREAPEKVLKLVRETPKGGLYFECRSTGEQTVAITLPGASVGRDEHKRLKVSVHTQGHDLEMTGVVATPADGSAAVLKADGQAVEAILAAMGRVDDFVKAQVVFDDGTGHTLGLDVPQPRDLARVSAVVCHRWTELANAALFGESGGRLHEPGTDGPARQPSSGTERQDDDPSRKLSLPGLPPAPSSPR